MKTKNWLQSDIAEMARRLAPVNDLFAGKTLLFTGAGGFLGTHFMGLFDHLNRHVLKQPLRVIAMDNFFAAASTQQQLSHFTTVDLRQHNVIEPVAITEKVDFVLHAACIASPVWYRTNPLETLDASTLGTRAMLELARRDNAAFLYFSSSEIYGDPDPRHVPTSENYAGSVSCRGPRACYDEGKRVGETLCDIYHNHFGLRTITVRPFNVFGPGLHERDYRVLPNFAARVKAGQPLEVYGSGAQTRTFCYIVDAIVGIVLALARGVPGEAYNVGNPNPELSMVELAERVKRMVGSRVEYRVVDYPDGYPSNEPQRRCPNIRKAELHLGFEPAVSLDEGLKRFFGWSEETYQGVLATLPDDVLRQRGATR